jgi:hypothetical protein
MLDERWTLLTLHDDLKIPSLLYFSHKTLRLNICNPQGTSPLLVLREGKADGFTNKLMNVGHCSPFMMT